MNSTLTENPVGQREAAALQAASDALRENGRFELKDQADVILENDTLKAQLALAKAQLAKTQASSAASTTAAQVETAPAVKPAVAKPATAAAQPRTETRTSQNPPALEEIYSNIRADEARHSRLVASCAHLFKKNPADPHGVAKITAIANRGRVAAAA